MFYMDHKVRQCLVGRSVFYMDHKVRQHLVVSLFSIHASVPVVLVQLCPRVSPRSVGPAMPPVSPRVVGPTMPPVSPRIVGPALPAGQST
ncbi:hypothetical protein ACOMHN_013955 [Nucella lapillus]